MTALDLYGVVAAAAVFLAFYSVRNIVTYIKACVAVVLGTGVATSLTVGAGTLAEGVILVAGVALFAFGLLFVRIMFIRSVSLNMLRGIQDGSAAGFGEDIGGRLRDMRAFRLIRSPRGVPVEADSSAPEQGEPTYTLTAFGRLVSTVTALFYALLRVKA